MQNAFQFSIAGMVNLRDYCYIVRDSQSSFSVSLPSGSVGMLKQASLSWKTLGLAPWAVLAMTLSFLPFSLTQDLWKLLGASASLLGSPPQSAWGPEVTDVTRNTCDRAS